MKRRLTLLLALGSFIWFLREIAIRGWSGPSTDFPNYYTAAVLARARQPLRHYYEWTWFQRRMHFAGIDHQPGGYIPQTPLTMVPFVPLSAFSPLAARRIWFVLNLVFLGLTLCLLTRITRFKLAELWLLAFLGFFTLRSNFELGQYYVFLLALLTLGVFFVLRKREAAGGVFFGTAIALKLYGAPLLLLALCGRRWRMVAGILGALLFSIACALAAFGRTDLIYFAGQVLPRSLRGETLDPWHLSNGTAATLLRRLFLKEAELNPGPLFDSPATFTFLITLFTLTILVFPGIGAALHAGPPAKRTLAWWLIGMLLVSPNTASYTGALLILPVALLLDELPGHLWIWLLTPYFLITLPLWPVWNQAFPRLWLLIVLFVVAGYDELRSISRRGVLIATAAVLAVSVACCLFEEQPKLFRRAVTQTGAIYSSAPALSAAGLVYESMGRNAWVLRHGGRTYSFAGDAFHPAVPDSGRPVYFELVSGRHSEIMSLNEETGQAQRVPIDVPDPREPAVAHDGKALAVVSGDTLFVFGGQSTRRLAARAHDPAFAPEDRDVVFVQEGITPSIRLVNVLSGSSTALLEDAGLKDAGDLATPSLSSDRRQLLFAARRGANWQVWVKDLVTGKEKQITSGRCNHVTPVFAGLPEILFAGDCRRGLGLPALFRAALQ
jgi:hypothetical protein